MTSMAAKKEQGAAPPLPQNRKSTAAEPVAAQRPVQSSQNGHQGENLELKELGTEARRCVSSAAEDIKHGAIVIAVPSVV